MFSTQKTFLLCAWCDFFALWSKILQFKLYVCLNYKWDIKINITKTYNATVFCIPGIKPFKTASPSSSKNSNFFSPLACSSWPTALAPSTPVTYQILSLISFSVSTQYYTYMYVSIGNARQKLRGINYFEVGQCCNLCTENSISKDCPSFGIVILHKISRLSPM